MIKNNKIENKKLKTNFLLMMFIITTTIFLSIGYAAINPITLDITGTASAIAQEGVFITGVNLVESSNIEEANVLNVYQTMLQTDIVLSPNTINTYAKYEISVYNSTEDNYCFYQTNYEGLYTNSDIEFELEDLQEGDFINAGEYKIFSITFKYATTTVPSNNELESYIDFVFKKAYKVTYENITNNNYPSYAIAEETFSVTFSAFSEPIEVNMGGTVLTSSDYTYSNYVLNISNVSGDIHVRKLNKYTIKNLVQNGSFENGLDGWTVVGDYYSWQPTNISKFGQMAYYRKPSDFATAFLTQSIYWNNEHKYYFFAYAVSTSHQQFLADITNKGGSMEINPVLPNYTKGNGYYVSDFTGYNTISINFAQITDNVIIDGIGVVDLTDGFGIGNEPTYLWCIQNIEYFDGSTTIYK